VKTAKALLLSFTAVALVACGAAATITTATPSATPTPTATPATASPTAATAASGKAWTVTAASKATVSVREQLVGVSLPSDAVLTATGGTGTFQLNADGTFTSDSKITFDLSTLASDNRDRDNFIKQDTLQVRQFPKAELVPTKTSGLALPLATSGIFTFKLTGNLTIHGKTKG
jgi:polyisoprenoid-binding protein YceI